MKRILNLKNLLLPCALITLAGCTPPIILGAGAGAANYVLNKDIVNLRARNYAAADYMITQSKGFIGKKDLIKAEPLTDSLEPQLSSAVGEIIPHQVGERLAQLGYYVDLSDVTRQGENFHLAPSAEAIGKTPRFILTGTYTRHKRELIRVKKDLTVNLRITDIKTGRTLGAFDYTVEMSGEVDEFSEPKPVIIRTTEN